MLCDYVFVFFYVCNCFFFYINLILLIVNMLNNVFRFPALRHLDWLLGGLFGLVRGAVIVMLIFAVIPTVSSALESMNISLLSDLVNASTFGKFFESSNLVANTLPTILP